MHLDQLFRAPSSRTAGNGPRPSEAIFTLMAIVCLTGPAQMPVADAGVQRDGCGPEGRPANSGGITFIPIFSTQSPGADLSRPCSEPGTDVLRSNNDFIAFSGAFFRGTGCV